MLQDGRISVNGTVASLGDQADSQSDLIAVDGIPLETAPDKVYLILNKPRGYVTTLSDEHGRKNVSELVQDCGVRVYPVGRLDQYSEGLLILTNDGAFANEMMHPAGNVRKIYHVWVNCFREEALRVLKSSIMIDGKKTIPAEVRVLFRKNDAAMLEFTLFDGRNRQIRRLCEAASLTVTRLKRTQEGDLKLDDLPVGKWRYLTREEVACLHRNQ